MHVLRYSMCADYALSRVLVLDVDMPRTAVCYAACCGMYCTPGAWLYCRHAYTAKYLVGDRPHTHQQPPNTCVCFACSWCLATCMRSGTAYHTCLTSYHRHRQLISGNAACSSRGDGLDTCACGPHVCTPVHASGVVHACTGGRSADARWAGEPRAQSLCGMHTSAPGVRCCALCHCWPEAAVHTVCMYGRHARM